MYLLLLSHITKALQLLGRILLFLSPKCTSVTAVKLLKKSCGDFDGIVIKVISELGENFHLFNMVSVYQYKTFFSVFACMFVDHTES